MGAVFRSTYTPPSRMFTPDGFKRTLREAFKDAGQQAIDPLEKLTADWRNPPQFKITVVDNRMSIETTHRIFNILNEGAQPHDIRPKRKKRLAFTWAGRGSYMPKTKPGTLRAYVGMAGKKVRSGEMVRPYVVRHPGIKARRWDIVLADRFDEKVTAAVARKVDKLFR